MSFTINLCLIIPISVQTPLIRNGGHQWGAPVMTMSASKQPPMLRRVSRLDAHGPAPATGLPVACPSHDEGGGPPTRATLGSARRPGAEMNSHFEYTCIPFLLSLLTHMTEGHKNYVQPPFWDGE